MSFILIVDCLCYFVSPMITKLRQNGRNRSSRLPLSRCSLVHWLGQCAVVFTIHWSLLTISCDAKAGFLLHFVMHNINKLIVLLLLLYLFLLSLILLLIVCLLLLISLLFVSLQVNQVGCK